MNKFDEFKCLTESYYGIVNLDEYELKEYEIQRLRKMMDDYDIDNSEKERIKNDVKENSSVKRNLQSCLITYSKLDTPIDLIILIKRKLKTL